VHSTPGGSSFFWSSCYYRKFMLQSYRASPAIWDHTVLPATWPRWMHLATITFTITEQLLWLWFVGRFKSYVERTVSCQIVTEVHQRITTLLISPPSVRPSIELWEMLSYIFCWALVFVQCCSSWLAFFVFSRTWTELGLSYFGS